MYIQLTSANLQNNIQSLPILSDLFGKTRNESEQASLNYE